MHHASIHNARPRTTAADDHDAAAEGFVAWIVLYAVLMIAAMTFFAGANVLGDRFDRIAPVASISER